MPKMPEEITPEIEEYIKEAAKELEEETLK